jgi:hypothetical protein
VVKSGRTPGSTTYDTVAGAVIVPADGDFGDCLEILKNDSVQKVRWMAQTPVQAGCYWQISARVKAISGNLPDVRIAGYAAQSGGAHLSGVVEVGDTTTLTSYGEVVTVTAIVGTGVRTGVDFAWGTDAAYGHFGLDLTGNTGGVVRIESVEVTDVTSHFLRDLLDWVDVKDYGVVGDGVTDDRTAFVAADAAAAGRTVLVSAGSHYIGSILTMNAPVRFEGTVTMPDTAFFSLLQNFDLPSYSRAFGNEEVGFRKAIQALFHYTDHVSLDLCGRRVYLDAPVNVNDVVGDVNSFSNRRVIRNGQIAANNTTAFDDTVVVNTGSYTSGNSLKITGLSSIAQIDVGSRVTGTGVGQEVYVRAKNEGANEVTLSQPLYGPAASQSYTFTRHKYLMEFHGFSTLSRFVFSDIEFLCQGICSAVLLPTSGITFHFQDCFFATRKDRGVSSSGSGCQGMMIDRCQFISNEQPLNVQDRTSVGFNSNANDVKVRENRASRFKHWAVMNGTGHIITGNHFFQGDNAATGLRTAGLILTKTNCKTTITANYIDNCSIEWNNEHDAEPDNNAEFSFGALTISGNHFTSNGSASWFRFLVIKPYGSGHYINGFSVISNAFKHIGGGFLTGLKRWIAAMQL